ncbi:hypothetical protein D3C77_479030 [compost metagenome]
MAKHAFLITAKLPRGAVDRLYHIVDGTAHATVMLVGIEHQRVVPEARRFTEHDGGGTRDFDIAVIVENVDFDVIWHASDELSNPVSFTGA